MATPSKSLCVGQTMVWDQTRYSKISLYDGFFPIPWPDEKGKVPQLEGHCTWKPWYGKFSLIKAFFKYKDLLYNGSFPYNGFQARAFVREGPRFRKILTILSLFLYKMLPYHGSCLLWRLSLNESKLEKVKVLVREGPKYLKYLLYENFFLGKSLPYRDFNRNLNLSSLRVAFV